MQTTLYLRHSALWLHSIKCIFILLQVCEKHFSPDAIIRTTDVIDSSTGKVVSIPLTFPRLKDGVVPTQFQSYPVSLAKSAAEPRPSPSEKRTKADMGKPQFGYSAKSQGI